MAFPATRLRRLRSTGVLRSLVRETELSVSHLVYPMFVVATGPKRTPIAEKPAIFIQPRSLPAGGGTSGSSGGGAGSD